MAGPHSVTGSSSFTRTWRSGAGGAAARPPRPFVRPPAREGRAGLIVLAARAAGRATAFPPRAGRFAVAFFATVVFFAAAGFLTGVAFFATARFFAGAAFFADVLFFATGVFFAGAPLFAGVAFFATTGFFFAGAAFFATTGFFTGRFAESPAARRFVVVRARFANPVLRARRAVVR